VLAFAECLFLYVCTGSNAMKDQFGEESEKFKAYQAKQEKSKKDKSKSTCAWMGGGRGGGG